MKVSDIGKARELRRKAEEELRGNFQQLRDAMAGYVAQTDARLAKLEIGSGDARKTLRELVVAVNSASLLLASVERHLDGVDPDWDVGHRAELARRADLLRERRDVLDGISGEGVDLEERVRRATRFWELARELGTTSEDGPGAVALLLQAGEPFRAARVLEEFAAMNPKLTPEQLEVLGKLRERVQEVTARDGRILVPQ